MNAYVTCRPDLGYSITTLSKFSTCPSPTHYNLLKGVALYLRCTKHWGISYRKTKIDPTLPSRKTDDITLPDDLPPFPEPTHPLDLTCFVDAAHANDLRNRQSTTGYAFLLCGGAISY